MRSENEIMSMIKAFAQKNQKVRALLFNGSRVNSAINIDILSDYDFMFLVTEPDSFANDTKWLDSFGDILITRCYDFSTPSYKRYILLTLFQDYTRIDIQLFHIDQFDFCLSKSSLTDLLIDKDNRCKAQPVPSNESHFVTKPTEAQFDEIIQDFWWFSTCAAKALWRKELPTVKFNFDFICHHDCLIKLFSWYVGYQRNWQVDVGKNGKWLQRYLPEHIWNSYCSIFAKTEYEEIWIALFAAANCVNEIGRYLALQLQYQYPTKQAEDVLHYLHKIRSLPSDAVEF
jgi:aminoglycoside 6-adenylyltransferase